MPAIPKYAQDLITQNEVHRLHLANLRHEVDELSDKHDSLRDTLAEIREEIAVINHKVDALTEQIKKLESKWSSLLIGVILALVALVANLIVALMRK
jgi:predicted nuclease with TOPRIM domain